MPQSLHLEVSGRHAAQFGSRSRMLFEGRGGSIGRSEDCDWVLSAAGISRIHAMIRHLNGMYFVEDRSTNGMLLNGAALVKGDPSALKDGDRLLIDNFEVECRLQDDAAVAAGPADDLDFAFGAAPSPQHAATPIPAAATPAVAPVQDDPFDFSMFDASPAAAVAKPAEASLLGDDLLGDWGVPASGKNDLDPLSFLGAMDEPAAAAGSGSAPGWNHSAGMADHFRPPTASMSLSEERRQTSSLPENWDLTMGDFAPKKPVPVAAPPPTPPPRVAASPVASQVQPRAPVPQEGAAALPSNIDEIFRVVVDGVMDVLRARAEIKNTFRLPVTIIQRSENNPLKFAPTSDDALQKILAPPNSAFLSGTAAFQDAFDDIRCHQMAMLAGVRAAFESLLAHFSPERFEREVDGGSKRPGLMDFAGKNKYWEKYRENFEGLNKNPDEAFRRLFGDEFARAYEEQLARLKSARRNQGSGLR